MKVKAKALLAMTFALALSVLLTPAVSAHTAMLRASPDRDAVVGGSISVIDLEFLEPVTGTSVTVSYNGIPVPGETTVADGELINYTLEQPLTDPGRYQVSYEMISADGDFTTGGYFFTFDPSAAEPARIELESSGVTTPVLLVAGVGLAGVAALIGYFVWRTNSRLREPLVDAGDSVG